MEWHHLPVAGGLYDQSPILLDNWQIIRQVEAEARDRDMKERERKMQDRSGSGRVAGRRR
jgi:hypothetical protein